MFNIFLKHMYMSNKYHIQDRPTATSNIHVVHCTMITMKCVDLHLKDLPNKYDIPFIYLSSFILQTKERKSL